MSSPRNHHFVPQFYFRPWRNKNGLVWSYHRPRAEVQCSQVSLKSIASERDLYAFMSPKQADTQVVEKSYFTKKIDTPAAAIRDKMLSGLVEALSDEERRIWAKFLSSLLLRRPAVLKPKRLDAVDKFSNILLGLVVDKLGPDAGGLTKDTIASYMHEKAPGSLEDITLYYLIKVIESNQFLDEILSLEWFCIKTQFDLATGDHPFVVEKESGRLAVFCVPLSPRCHFVASTNFRQKMEQLAVLNPIRYVMLGNKALISNAERFVIYTDNRLRPFVEKHLRKAPECDCTIPLRP